MNKITTDEEKKAIEHKLERLTEQFKKTQSKKVEKERLLEYYKSVDKAEILEHIEKEIKIYDNRLVVLQKNMDRLNESLT